ncbi:hypothetical protein MMC10_002343 [Thelotrema lepadinum]|nr:hypothetical protein [Thelotrema lepadinum]
MAPIRVALIGLSSSAKTSWAATAHLPYLTSARGKARYEIVALLNSSVKAAEAAKKAFDLPSSVKAYGDPAAVAADPDIELLVCNTRVDLHFPTVEPSIKAGKAVFVEWPLADSLERAAALTNNGRLDNSIVGLQRRISPIVSKVKEIIDSGRIGRVLSSNVYGINSHAHRGAASEGLKYFTQRKIGGNPMTIHVGHMIDFVHYTLGDFDSFQGRMQIQRPTVAIIGENGTQVDTVQSDVPDLLVVHGSLVKSEHVVDGATLSVHLRSSPPFKGQPSLLWTITGEKGEILVSSPNGVHLQEPVTIQLQDFATDEVTDIKWDWEDWQKELPALAREIAAEYDRYANWVESGKPASVTPDQDWPRLHDAVSRHREIETLFQQFDAQQ